MIDLTTTYLGMKLKNPIVASASPICESLTNICRLEEAGAAAVVLHSLFEEQIETESQALDWNLDLGSESFPEALSYLPDLNHYNLGPEGYLELIRSAKQAVEIPIIASLNGASLGGWVEYALKMQDAGADALELNIYYIPTSVEMSGAEVERRYVELVQTVKRSVTIPVAVKLGHFFSSIPNIALQLSDAGADGLVLFNRFYQPDFDIENLKVTHTLTLSSPYELLLRLHWIAVLYGHIKSDMAVTGGIHSATDVLKAMMAGARVAMTTSALLKHGIDHIAKIRAELAQWMEEHEYESIAQMQGSMCQRHVEDPSAFERANYMRVLSSYSLRTPRDER
jgi:dihydroorotate dehydrogenase (fumarate)